MCTFKQALKDCKIKVFEELIGIIYFKLLISLPYHKTNARNNVVGTILILAFWALRKAFILLHTLYSVFHGSE